MQSASTVVYALLFGCGFTAAYIGKQYLNSTRTSCPLPPGPPGLPWLGPIFGFSMSELWLTFRNWAKTYGDVVYFQRLGEDIIVINSERIAKDLLDHGTADSSDRPSMFINELSGSDYATGLLPYGDRWRLHRRFFHQTFRIDAAQRFLPCQHHTACQLLRQLFNTPGRFEEHVIKYNASTILNSVYDCDPSSHVNYEFLTSVVKVKEARASVLRPDITIIVSAFPILLRLPAWVHGMSFKKNMQDVRRLTKQFIEMAFEYSLQKMVNNIATLHLSMIHDALRNMEEKKIEPNGPWMNGLKEAAASVLGGMELSDAVLLTFFLLMALNPAVREKAQAQIDIVVGNDRLPALGDRPSLPFIDAILWEVLRYNPAAPVSFPHGAVDDIVYRGFRIPRGATLVANVWAMAHDESKYPNPHAFMPERFLNEDGSLKPNDADYITYGFGRRICPGRHFADASMWFVIAKVLAVFRILKPLDANEVEMSIEPNFSKGFLVRPLPFQCRIVPRAPGMDSEKLEELIAASAA